MRNLIIIAAVVALSATVYAGPPWINATADIPVVMDIEPVASIALNDAVIKLFQITGSTDYEGHTVAPNQPVVTCNVPVTVEADTVPVLPDVSSTGKWRTAIRPNNYAGTANSIVNIIDPLATPWTLDVWVKANNVDMTQRPDGPDVRVATTTITVTPI